MKEIPEKILLEMITTTENKKKILLALNKKSYFIRELAKEIGITPRAVQWELRRFEKLGIVTYVSDGKRKFYILTKKGKNVVDKLKSL